MIDVSVCILFENLGALDVGVGILDAIGNLNVLADLIVAFVLGYDVVPDDMRDVGVVANMDEEAEVVTVVEIVVFVSDAPVADAATIVIALAAVADVIRDIDGIEMNKEFAVDMAAAVELMELNRTAAVEIVVVVEFVGMIEIFELAVLCSFVILAVMVIVVAAMDAADIVVTLVVKFFAGIITSLVKVIFAVALGGEVVDIAVIIAEVVVVGAAVAVVVKVAADVNSLLKVAVAAVVVVVVFVNVCFVAKADV